jgi:hypothetical protein
VLAYSTIGLAIAVYAADFTGFVQSLKFWRINPSVLFPFDIDKQQYPTPNDNRTRGKKHFYQERSITDTYGQSFFPKTIRD